MSYVPVSVIHEEILKKISATQAAQLGFSTADLAIDIMKSVEKFQNEIERQVQDVYNTKAE